MISKHKFAGLQGKEAGKAALPAGDREETKIRGASFPSAHTILNGCRAGQIECWQWKVYHKTKHGFNYLGFGQKCSLRLWIEAIKVPKSCHQV